jgi:ribosomal protein S18 acetylase RimI-like enzyme
MSDDVPIRALASDQVAWTCADLMASTDPWITLQRTRDDTFKVVTNPAAHTFAVDIDGRIAGLVVIAQNVPLLGGYIMTLAVAPAYRNCGIGKRLLAFAEDLIFRDSPNVFLCVSSFNHDAQRFYERLGYERIGELKNFIIEGAGEILMRKTLGPKTQFKKKG